MLRQQDARNFTWVPGYGLSIHQISWISFFERPNSIIPCTCSSNLKYSIKFNETKKLTKYSKKSQNCPKFEHGVLNNVGRPHKKWVKKTKKKFAECRPWHSAKRSFAECQEVALSKEGIFTECRALALGKDPLCRVPGPALGKDFFFNLTAWAGSAVKCHFFV